MPMLIESATLVRYQGKDSRVAIPEGVMTIASNAFKDCTDLVHVHVPKTVRLVGDHAFSGCVSLKSVRFDNFVNTQDGWFYNWLPRYYDVTEVGHGVFDGCCHLQTVTIANKKYPFTYEYPFVAFEWAVDDQCNRMGSFTIEDGVLTAFEPDIDQEIVVVPDGVTRIARNVFSGESCCYDLDAFDDDDPFKTTWSSIYLRYVVLPEGLREIEDCSFAYCHALEGVYLPSSLASIGDYAFGECERLRLSLPSAVRSIGKCAFACCAGLERVTIPKGVTTVKEGTFSQCDALQDVALPPGLEEIGKEAFLGCSSLVSIHLPEGVTSICERAFAKSGLRSLYLPATATNIGVNSSNGWHAFCDCCDLERISISEGNSMFDSRDNCNAIIHTSSDSLLLGCKGSEIPSTVCAIGDFAFAGVRGLTSIAVSEGVTRIGESAFYDCRDLRSVMLGTGLRELCGEAFAYCTDLGHIDLPEGLVRVDERCFQGCRSLRRVRIPSSVTYVGRFAFLGCSALEHVSVGTGLRTFENGAFYNCESLRSIVVDKDNPHLVSRVFPQSDERDSSGW